MYLAQGLLIVTHVRKTNMWLMLVHAFEGGQVILVKRIAKYSLRVKDIDFGMVCDLVCSVSTFTYARV